MATDNKGHLRLAGSSDQPRDLRSKYPPEHFIVPGQDNNGNSVRIFCRVPPLLDRSLDIIFGSRNFPFKSKGDIVRWCVKFGVDTLERMEPVKGSVTAQVDAMLSVLRDEDANHAFLTLFNTMSHTIGMHIQAQAMGEARRVVHSMRSLILRIENDYWRGRYLRELDEKFGHLLDKTVAGANMGTYVQGPEEDEEV